MVHGGQAQLPVRKAVVPPGVPQHRLGHGAAVAFAPGVGGARRHRGDRRAVPAVDAVSLAGWTVSGRRPAALHPYQPLRLPGDAHPVHRDRAGRAVGCEPEPGCPAGAGGDRLNPRILIIVPAYNEEAAVGGVIRSIFRHRPDADVLVVNDGSRDRTAEVAAEAGARVITLPVNLGIGGAMQTGYRYAAQYGYDIAVQLDADGQHDPSDLGRVLAPLLSGAEVDMVVGSRYVERTSYRSTAFRRAGMIILAAVVRIILGYPVKDTTSGYRAVNRRVIELFAHWYPTDYPEPEAIVYLHRNGYRILEVPVSMREREAGRSSITPFRSAYYMIKVLLSMLMNTLRSGSANARLARETGPRLAEKGEEP
ncbi:MAG: glycosyltransferase family 2 protein [Alicyclobacillus sp.]|nr:glycosyltransferase family 2 protein [Alicyclobacillus sp.]